MKRILLLVMVLLVLFTVSCSNAPAETLKSDWPDILEIDFENADSMTVKWTSDDLVYEYTAEKDGELFTRLSEMFSEEYYHDGQGEIKEGGSSYRIKIYSDGELLCGISDVRENGVLVESEESYYDHLYTETFNEDLRETFLQIMAPYETKENYIGEHNC